MFCSKCGKEIDDEAYVCVGCGCLTGVNDKKSVSENEIPPEYHIKKDISNIKLISLLSIIIGAFVPLAGWALGGLGLFKIKNFGLNEDSYKPDLESAKKKCYVGIGVATALFILVLILLYQEFEYEIVNGLIF